MPSELCFICEKHRSTELDGYSIFENDLVYAGHIHASENEIYLGHVVVEPKRHVEGLAALTQRIEHELAHTARRVDLLVPYAEGASLAELHALAGSVSRQDTPEGVRVRALMPPRLAARFARFAVAGPSPRAA